MFHFHLKISCVMRPSTILYLCSCHLDLSLYLPQLLFKQILSDLLTLVTTLKEPLANPFVKH